MPAMNATELQIMVKKTVSYETNPPEGDWRRTAINAYGFVNIYGLTFREEFEKARVYFSGFNQIEYAMPDQVMDDGRSGPCINDQQWGLYIVYVGAWESMERRNVNLEHGESVEKQVALGGK